MEPLLYASPPACQEEPQETLRQIQCVFATGRTQQARARTISDDGPPFVARDVRGFIRLSGIAHVRTSPYDPLSDGKLERYHRTIKSGCIRPGVPLSLADARSTARRASVGVVGWVGRPEAARDTTRRGSRAAAGRGVVYMAQAS